MHAVGFMRKSQGEYIEYRRGGDFNGEFRIFTMADADLGGCHVRGKNGNSVMAGATFVNESHCYSYSNDQIDLHRDSPHGVSWLDGRSSNGDLDSMCLA
jgi:hypothetical protein